MTGAEDSDGFGWRAYLLRWVGEVEARDVPEDAVLAPWTLEQVRRLNARQSDARAQSYYCPKCGVELFATRFGWLCAGRASHFRQDWALERHINQPFAPPPREKS